MRQVRVEPLQPYIHTTFVSPTPPSPPYYLPRPVLWWTPDLLTPSEFYTYKAVIVSCGWNDDWGQKGNTIARNWILRGKDKCLPTKLKGVLVSLHYTMRFIVLKWQHCKAFILKTLAEFKENEHPKYAYTYVLILGYITFSRSMYNSVKG